MKNLKKTRTLSLTRETIKKLCSDDLIQVAGGTGDSVVTCNEMTICAPTRAWCANPNRE